MEEGPQFWSWDLDNGGWASIQLGWVQRKREEQEACGSPQCLLVMASTRKTTPLRPPLALWHLLYDIYVTVLKEVPRLLILINYVINREKEKNVQDSSYKATCPISMHYN